MLFLCETRKSEERVESLPFRPGMKDCFHVPGDGNGGVISLYSQEGVTVDLLSFSTRHIDVHISGGLYDRMWRGTFIYGEPKLCDIDHFWTMAHIIKPISNEPWLMIGDFNKARWQEEHFSLSKRSERHEGFPRAVITL
jgi:hypothetical protein